MESKEIEVRFYLIGDKGIGKESILSRFKILNCSKTNTSEEDNFSKVLQIEGFNIELKFFPIENPEEIKFNDSLNEDKMVTLSIRTRSITLPRWLNISKNF